jgi:hypothetical protein
LPGSGLAAEGVKRVAKGTVSLERLEEEIQTVQYRDAAESFCRLVAEEERPLRELVRAAISAAAPFVQVPSHVMKQPNGDMRGVNYDHTVLGWRGAIALTSQLPKAQVVLPTVQAMWYAPQGLDVWDQLLCQFPGHYANAEQCNRRFPGPEGQPNRFDGPAWIPPKVYFEDCGPLHGGSVEERLDRFNWALSEGAREEAYGLFLGLAEDPGNREQLNDRLLMAGIMDVQDTLINRTGYQNIGHKALRARALVDLAGYFGWENSRELIYTVVPDLGCSPRLYGLWNEVSSLVQIELSKLGTIAKRTKSPLTDSELDELSEVLLWGSPGEVNDTIIRYFKRGCGILDITDGIAVGYQRYLVDVLEHPSAFNYPMHAFDYLNVVNTWVRGYDNPHQVKAPFMTARFVNDAIRFNAMYPRDPQVALAPRSDFRGIADELPVGHVLPALLEAILAQEAPLAGALVDSYLERSSERTELIQTITYAACHFQNDPHILRNCTSSIEEFTYNQTNRRDDILRGFVKHQARYVKRTLAPDAFGLYARYFDPAATPVGSSR